MKITRASELDFIPASHEDPKNPGSLKKILAKSADISEGNIQMINWALLPVGKSFQAHYHQDMQEIFIILSGKVSITIDQEIKNLTKGDMIIIPTMTTHVMENTSKVDVEYIVLGVSKEGKGQTINV